MSSRVRAASLLLTALLLVASTSASAEPGKDPHGRSADAPGQQKDKHHGHDQAGQDPAPSDAPTDWSLNLVVDGLSGINEEFHRVVREHQEAGIPVTIEPGPGLIDNAPALEDLAELVDPDLLALPAPQPAPLSNGAMSEDDCELLILAVMDEPPFLDPIVRPECASDGAELPLDKLPTDRLPIPDPGEGGINLQITPGKK